MSRAMLTKFLITFALILPFVVSQGNTQALPSCEGVEDFTFIASQTDCAIYYECIDGIAYRLQCPRGNYFSTREQTCVPYSESDCPLLTPSPPPSIPTCDDVEDFWFIPSLDSCYLYYQCIDQIPYLLQCPRGLYFSFEQQNCVNPNDSDCPLIQTTPEPTTTMFPPPRPPRPTCDDVENFDMIPTPICNQYLMCIDGTDVLLQCPRGFYFSFANQNCGSYDETDCYLWADMHE